MSKLRKRTMLAVLIAAASVVVVASTVTRHLSNEELACTVNLSVGVKDIEVGSGGIVCLPPGETYASWAVGNHQHWSANVETPHKLRFKSYGQATRTQAYITSGSGEVYWVLLEN